MDFDDPAALPATSPSLPHVARFIWPEETPWQPHEEALRRMLATPSVWKPQYDGLGILVMLIGRGERPCHFRIDDTFRYASITWRTTEVLGPRGSLRLHLFGEHCDSECHRLCASDFTDALARWLEHLELAEAVPTFDPTSHDPA